jgi:hypothetical protein
MTPAPRHPETMAAAAPRPEATAATAALDVVPPAVAAPAAVPAGDPVAPVAPVAPRAEATAPTRPTPVPLPPSPVAEVHGPTPPAPEIETDLERYARKHHRYAVDWLATLRSETVTAVVRIFDISAASIGVECSEVFDVGQKMAMVFDQLPQRATVSATVLRRIPRGLVLEAEIPEAVIEAAAAGQPARLAG